jgi:hypothetical protein
MTFRNLDLFPSSGEGGETPTQLGPLQIANLNHWTTVWDWVLCYNRQSVGQSVWNKAPIWGLQPDFYYYQTVAGLLMWGTLSEEKTGLSFTIAAGPCQRSHSCVQVPCDSWPYFTASDSRLPLYSPPMTHRATVEVFKPASTWDIFLLWQPLSDSARFTQLFKHLRLG